MRSGSKKKKDSVMFQKTLQQIQNTTRLQALEDFKSCSISHFMAVPKSRKWKKEKKTKG